MPESTAWFITSFYHFIEIENPKELSEEWTAKARQHGIDGLVILGSEGFNTTCSSVCLDQLQEFKAWVVSRFECPDMMFKDSVSTAPPFPRFKVKIRSEIVTSGTPDLVPDNRPHRHLSPEEWNRTLKEENVMVLDTRNWYEVRIGTFKNAINPKLDQFTEFPEFVDSRGFAKDQKMLIFCTGGIRCEKGILELERRGYKNVYQLEGGILNYLEKFPNDEFEGQCFVFDNRVAVDQNLQPTVKFKLCPHCGQPGETTLNCARCDSEFMICISCFEKEVVREVCSKNCAHHYSLYPGRKGQRQESKWEVARKPRVDSALSAQPLSSLLD